MPSENWPTRCFGDVLQADELDQLIHTRSRDPLRLRLREEVVVGGPPGWTARASSSTPDIAQRRCVVA